MLESRKIKCFLEVAKAGSFRLAARSLGMSQPALTRQIQALEADLGVTLLHRGARIAKPTQAGAILVERGERLLEDLRQIHTLVQSTAVAAVGTVTLALLTSFSANYGSAILKRLREKLPGVRVRMTEGTSLYVEERLAAGQADVGLIIARETSEKYILESLMSEEFQLFGRRIPDRRQLWTFRDIADLPLVLPPHGTRKLIDDAARQQGARLEPQFEVDSPYLIRDLMVSQEIYAILPSTAVSEERRLGRLESAAIEGAPRRSLAVATMKGHPLSVAARAVALELRRITDGSQGR